MVWKVLLNIRNSSENIHIWVYELCSMSKPGRRIFSPQLDRLNPLHGLNIKNFDSIGELLCWLISIFAEKPSKEDQKRVIDDARLFFVFGLTVFGHGMGVGPFAARDVEGVEVVKHFPVMSSINQYFVAVVFHGVIGSAIRHYFFKANLVKGWVDL